ncbi:MAG TPA: adenosylcobinamide-GDP ribazoletransferase [Anaerolineaceae bacterium]|nr:adenosylcobinamide-GDP ribazoletransferase [Anaerolineaceae bacterium]
MKSLKQAFAFMTILPIHLNEQLSPGDLGKASAWYPLVGVFIGGLVWLAKYGLQLIFPPLLTAVLCVAVWIFLSGGLHLDGLADCFDGMLNSSLPARRLEIMKDPRLGTFGGLGLLLAVLIKVAAVYSLAPGHDWIAILTAAALGRWMILLAGKQPLARPGGMGADFALGLTKASFAWAVILPVVLVILGGWRGLLAAGLAHLVALGIFGLARSRLGGVTGDVYGLIVEVTELVVLLTFAVQIR